MARRLPSLPERSPSIYVNKNAVEAKLALKPRLLIVDDEEAILFAGEMYFSDCGFDVDCARERRDAEVLLEHVRGAGECYSAVIADLRIRGVSDTEGLDILDYVKKRCPQALRILLTAYGSPEIERRACELGIDILLHKPKPLPEIARIISGFMHGHPITSLERKQDAIR